MRRLGRVVPKSVLEEKLYGIEGELESNAIPVHVHHLRRKLADLRATPEIHRARHRLSACRGLRLKLWMRSIEGQLSVRLAAIFVVASIMGVAAILEKGEEAAGSLNAESMEHELLREFVVDVVWVVPLFAVAILGVGIWSIRRALAPVRMASGLAARISPGATAVRLSTQDLPDELPQQNSSRSHPRACDYRNGTRAPRLALLERPIFLPTSCRS